MAVAVVAPEGSTGGYLVEPGRVLVLVVECRFVAVLAQQIAKELRAGKAIALINISVRHGLYVYSPGILCENVSCLLSGGGLGLIPLLFMNDNN